MHKNIITEETLRHGWEATFDDYVRGDEVGYGRTPEEAIADLLEKSEA